MRNVIKYRTNVVVCLVVAFGICHEIQQKNQQKHVWILFFHLSCQQPWFGLVELQKHPTICQLL